jgi:hypothetical protein
MAALQQLEQPLHCDGRELLAIEVLCALHLDVKVSKGEAKAGGATPMLARK